MFIRSILLIIGAIALGGILFILWRDKKTTITNDEIQPNIIKESSQKSLLYNYNQYPLGKQEGLLYLVFAGVVLVIVGYIFYQNIIIGFALTPMALLFPPYVKKQKVEEQKKQLNIEFKEALYMITTSLTVGKSLERAIKDAAKELEILYPSGKNHIIKELQYITRKVEMNETVEEAFQDFAKRSHVEDIVNFVDVLITCKRTGGNLVEVMRNTSKMITEKIEFQQELDLMLTKRKFEQKMLAIIPVGLILVLTWSAPDYMEPIFNTLLGRVIMTFSIGLFIIAMYISKKIIKIEV